MEALCSGPQTISISFLVRITRGLAHFAKSLTQIRMMPHTPGNHEPLWEVLQSGQSKIFWTFDPLGNVLHKCSSGPTATTSGMQVSIFQPWKRFFWILDMLEDTIYVIQMLPNEPMDPSVFLNDLIVLIIQANVLTIWAEAWLVWKQRHTKWEWTVLGVPQNKWIYTILRCCLYRVGVPLTLTSSMKAAEMPGISYVWWMRYPLAGSGQNL